MSATPRTSLGTSAVTPAGSTPSLDLRGQWTLALDRGDVGEREAWFDTDLSAQQGTDQVTLPGSLQAQGFGDEISLETPWIGLVPDHQFFTDARYAPYRTPGDIKVPFWLQPDRAYVGTAWFQREVDVPAELAGQELALELERTHWGTTLWLDGVRLGSQLSLTTAHRYELGSLSAGTHRLTIAVDNRMLIDVGGNAHSMADHTQGNWNGIIGAIRIVPIGFVRISSLRTYPDLATRSVTVRASVTASTFSPLPGTLTVSARRYNVPGEHQVAPVTVELDFPPNESIRGVNVAGGYVDVVLPLGEDAQTWDEFNPALYELTAELNITLDGVDHQDSRQTTFGLREVSTIGTQIAINDSPTFLRGTLESCVFPLTGHPPTDVQSWRDVFATCQAFGLNHVRFHSWCPPEAAFVAADECGIYLQVEGPIWANQGATVGENRPVDAFIYEESWRILEAYGNHPSFVLMAHGNEPGGRDAEFLAEWVLAMQRRDPRHLYTSGSGWPAIPESDFDSIPDGRIQQWGEGLDSRINGRAPETISDYSELVASRTRPIITHESGQWCAYPNLAEREKYTGFMKAKNFDIFADFLENAGLGHQGEDFLQASGKLQALCYKEELETALRTPGLAGVQLLGLSDFPGQGTAIVGVVDAFWEEKGYITAAEFARFCSPVVPLARLKQRTFSGGDLLTVGVQVANFSAAPFTADITWSLVNDAGVTLVSEVIPAVEIALGNQVTQAQISTQLPELSEAHRVTLVISVDSGDGAPAENDWELWVYPEPAALPREAEGTVVTRSLQEALAAAEAGATVLYSARSEDVDSEVSFGFSPAFWNTDWTSNQPPHTLGILCDPAHPLFESFPTDSHTNWQWWELIHQTETLNLDRLPRPVSSLVQVIDTWFEARHLGLVVEAQVGAGRLLISSIDVVSDLDNRLVARQLRQSMLSYLNQDVTPELTLTSEQVRSLFRSETA